MEERAGAGRRRWGRSRGFRAGGLLVAAGLLSAGCVSSLVLYPDTSSPARRDRIFVSGPEGRLEVIVERHRGGPGCEPSLYILEFIGNSGSAAYGSTFPRGVAGAAPMDIWVVNYHGFGASEGRAHFKNFAPTAEAAFDALNERARGRPIVVYGFSMGSLPALHLAGHRPAKGVIMRNVPCLKRLITRRYGWWNLWLASTPVALQVPRALGCRRAARNARVPGLYLMSTRDGVCPPSHQRASYRAYAGPKKLVRMEGVHHNSAVPPDVQRQMIEWLRETVGPEFRNPERGCPASSEMGDAGIDAGTISRVR